MNVWRNGQITWLLGLGIFSKKQDLELPAAWWTSVQFAEGTDSPGRGCPEQLVLNGHAMMYHIYIIVAIIVTIIDTINMAQRLIPTYQHNVTLGLKCPLSMLWCIIIVTIIITAVHQHKITITWLPRPDRNCEKEPSLPNGEENSSKLKFGWK